MNTLKTAPRWMETTIEIAILSALAFLPISKAIVEIGVTTGLVLWIIKKIWIREKLLTLPVLTPLYLAFLALGMLSLIQVPTQNLEQGLRGVLKWLEYIGLFFLCAELFQTERVRRRFVTVFLVSMTIISLNGFYQLWAGVDLLRQRELDPGRIIRMKSSLGAANTLAAFYLFAIPLLCITFFQKNKKNLKTVLGAGLFALFFSAFILTFSRGAFLAFVLTSFVYLVLKRQWKIALFSIAALCGLFLLSDQAYYNFVGSLNLNDVTIGERLRYWETAWRMIQAHPLLGNGINMYYLKFPSFAPLGETMRGYAHNGYLQIWSETGIFSLIVFLAAFFYGAYSQIRKRHITAPDNSLRHALNIALLSFLIQAAFDTNFHGLETSVLFWLFWGMLAALTCNRKGIKTQAD